MRAVRNPWISGAVHRISAAPLACVSHSTMSLQSSEFTMLWVHSPVSSALWDHSAVSSQCYGFTLLWLHSTHHLQDTYIGCTDSTVRVGVWPTRDFWPEHSVESLTCAYCQSTHHHQLISALPNFITTQQKYLISQNYWLLHKVLSFSTCQKMLILAPKMELGYNRDGNAALLIYIASAWVIKKTVVPPSHTLKKLSGAG